MGKYCNIDKLLEIIPFICILFAMIVLLFPAAIAYSQFNINSDKGMPTINENEILSRLSKNVSGVYVNPNLGFTITFPQGWSGIEANVMVTMVQVSPSGISPSDLASKFQNQDISISITGIPEALLEMAMPLASAFTTNESSLFGNSSPLDVIENVQQLAGCEHLSSSIMKLNNIIAEEKTDECTPVGHYIKTKSYSFATDKGLVTIGYSANDKTDYNIYLPKFDESIKSLIVSKPADVRTFGQELLGVMSHMHKVELAGQEHTIKIDSTQNISNIAFSPPEKSISFTTSAGKAIFGIAETQVNLGKLLSGPYLVSMDGNKMDSFQTVTDMIDNGTVLDLIHPQGLHTFVIAGK